LIKRFFSWLKRGFSSLRFRFIVVFVLAVFVAVGLYFTVEIAATALINNVYLSEENKEEREAALLDDLQGYIYDNGITSQNTEKIGEWARKNHYVYLLIYRGNELFFTSDDVPEGEPEDTPPDSSGGVGDGTEDTEDGKGELGGGITVKFPSREELLEYAKQNDMYLLEMSKTDEEPSGSVPIFAQFTDFSEYLYYDLSNVLALVLAAISIVLTLLFYMGRVTSRIIRLGEEVTVIAKGATDHSIVAEGNDEISALAINVESMRSSIIENYKREKAATEANNALITSMSHDIRTPLTILLGYIDVMSQHAEGDELMQGYIKAAENTAMRLKKLSDDMFGYFLVFGNKEMKLSVEDYDAETLIDQMLSEHILLMKENGYELDLGEIEVEELFGKSVRTDAGALVRIFDNAFSNLYKYADRAQPVKIIVSADACQIKIEISNKIRRDGERVESNGIGLKTCQKLAEIIGAGFETGADGDNYIVKLTLQYTEKSSS